MRPLCEISASLTFWKRVFLKDSLPLRVIKSLEKAKISKKKIVIFDWQHFTLYKDQRFLSIYKIIVNK